MAEDRTVRFCARVGPRSISIVMTNCPQSGRGQVTRRLNFWQISVRPNISKTMQNRDILTMED